MHLQETILCAGAPTTTSAGPGAISIHDFQTGATLASFKQTSAGSRCTAIHESTNTQGGFMLASQPDKSIMNVYNFQKDQLSAKIVLPEKLSCIAIDPRGDYCAGGTAQGRIHFWEISSGLLYNSWDAHYRKVNVLRFTSDGAALISGSDDSGVSVWSVSRLLDDELQNDLPTPYCTLSDHTLPVTDIVCGVGIFPSARVLTSSVDHSVKLWDLSSKSLLTAFQFPQPIAHLAWDVTERMFFAASNEGSIHQVNLFRQRESKFGGLITEAIGGAGVTDIINVEEENRKAKKRLISVPQPISSIAISLTSNFLLAGTLEGFVHIYDIPSHQLLRTITAQKGHQVSFLTAMIKPPDLIGHISLDFGPGGVTDIKDVIPVKPVIPFHRTRDAKARDAHEVSMMIPSHDSPYHDERTSYSRDEFFNDHSFFVQPSAVTTNEGADAVSLKSKVQDLENEVVNLREQLGKAKSINDTMWDNIVQKLVGQPNQQDANDVPLNNEDGDDAQKRRKRNRDA